MLSFSIAFVIQTSTAQNALSYTAFFSFRFDGSEMRVFMHCLRGEPAQEECLKVFLVLGQVELRKENGPGSFMEIPALAIEIRVERAIADLNICQEDILHSERQTRVTSTTRLDRVEDADLTALVRDVNFAATKIAGLVWEIESIVRTLEFMDEIVDEGAEKAREHRYPEIEIEEETRALRRKHQYLCSIMAGLTGRTQHLSKRADGQVQTARGIYAESCAKSCCLWYSL